MPSLTALLLLAVSAAPVVFAQSACSGQQYNNLPGFPASNSGCYPLNYYRTSDLGVTSPSDAATRCQQQCTADASCGSVVAQVNKAADSNSYSGTCFLYNKANTPSGPRQCGNPAYLLQGYQKDNTLGCFSSSAPAATAFCSSYLGIPVKTSTATVTPSPITTTVTVTTMPTTTTTTTSTVSVTTSTTTTSTATVSATATVLTTTTATSTISITSSVTTTATATATVTTTTTVTAAPKKKRTENQKRTAAATPACVTAGTPASRLSAACSCLNVPTSTTTTTTTLVPVTFSRTTTSTVSVTVTATSTTTSTATVPVTATTTVTVTSSTVTSTISASPVTTATGTTTITTTTTTTTTATATATYTPPTCTNPGTDAKGAGGCSSDCYCDTRVGTSGGICDQVNKCTTGCASDADCPAGTVCATSAVFKAVCGGPQCLSTAGCTTPSSSKRSLFGWTGEEQRAGRMASVNNARVRWSKRSSS